MHDVLMMALGAFIGVWAFAAAQAYSGLGPVLVKTMGSAALGVGLVLLLSAVATGAI